MLTMGVGAVTGPLPGPDSGRIRDSPPDTPYKDSDWTVAKHSRQMWHVAMMPNLKLGAVVLCGAFLLVACGQGDGTGQASTGQVQPAPSVEASNSLQTDRQLAASTPSWLLVGDELRKQRLELAEQLGDKYERTSNWGDYAYLSKPVSINGPGEYKLEFKIDGRAFY